MFVDVLATEFLKLRHTRITVLTWLASSIIPLVGGLFMWIVREPERARQLGLLGQKAQFAGVTADWTGYLSFVLQAVGIGGMILVSVIAAFVFGREYADGTAKYVLALPVPRHLFALAKLVVVLTWFGLLILSLLLEAFLVGKLLAFPGFSLSLAARETSNILLVGLVAWLLVPAVAWIATLGKGYLAPLGFTIFTLVLGMIVGATGWGKWFPWSIVPLFAGVAGPRLEVLSPLSLVILVLTSAAGVAAVVYQLRYADNTQ